MRRMVSEIQAAIGAWEGRRITDDALLNAIHAAMAEEEEYVALDAVLGRGRHEGDSGIDLREPTR